MALERSALFAAAGLVLALITPPALAQSGGHAGVAELRAEIARLKAEHAAHVAETRLIEERLNALESALGSPANTGPPTVNGTAPHTAGADSSLLAASAALPFEIDGDFRLRYESNYDDAGSRDWDRGVLRARLRAGYTVNDRLTLAGQVVTGDPDDPNSADVTLSNFNDDFDVSIDQAYARFHSGGLDLWGGKFPLPFSRSDLVWDGDVNPQGASASYRVTPGNAGAIRLSSLYFAVDNSVAGSDSSMFGNQLTFEGPLTPSLRLELSAAYYDYSLRGLAGADAGDIRSNLIGPDGRYVSDFNLLDGIAAITYTRSGDRWPVRVSAEYVNNRGARTSGDTGYSMDVTAGRASQSGDWRFAYGYSAAEVDAVLAAFSHDNTSIATNYRQHSLSVAHVLLRNLVLEATLYRYRPYDVDFAGTNDRDDWLNRLRLNFLVNF